MVCYEYNLIDCTFNKRNCKLIITAAIIIIVTCINRAFIKYIEVKHDNCELAINFVFIAGNLCGTKTGQMIRQHNCQQTTYNSGTRSCALTDIFYQ